MQATLARVNVEEQIMRVEEIVALYKVNTRSSRLLLQEEMVSH